MIILECRLNKVDNDWICTIYADGKPWLCLLEEEANDVVQKNRVKKFTTEENDYTYIERYCF
jgi:hypothetical protein